MDSRLALLKRAIDRDGVNEVAREIDMSKSTVSRVASCDYPNPDRVLAKVAAAYADLENKPDVCPILGEIHPDVCARYAAWAKEGRVHRDRMYRQVKDDCISCSKRKKR